MHYISSCMLYWLSAILVFSIFAPLLFGFFTSLSIWRWQKAWNTFVLPKTHTAVGLTEIVNTDERPTIPCFRESVVAEAAKHPHLGTIIRTIHAGWDVVPLPNCDCIHRTARERRVRFCFALRNSDCSRRKEQACYVRSYGRACHSCNNRRKSWETVSDLSAILIIMIVPAELSRIAVPFSAQRFRIRYLISL